MLLARKLPRPPCKNWDLFELREPLDARCVMPWPKWRTKRRRRKRTFLNMPGWLRHRPLSKAYHEGQKKRMEMIKAGLIKPHRDELGGYGRGSDDSDDDSAIPKARGPKKAVSKGPTRKRPRTRRDADDVKGESSRQSLAQADTIGSRISAFTTWAEQRGVRCGGAAVRDSGSGMGLGLFASRDLSPGDEIASVPASAIVNSNVAWQSASGKALRAVLRKAEWNSFLARPRHRPHPRHLLTPSEAAIVFFLIEQKIAGRDSSWHAWVEALPRSFDDPLWWSREQLKELEGTNLGETIASTERILREVYLAVYNKMRPRAPGVLIDVPYETLRWAFSAYKSRRFPGRLLKQATGATDDAKVVAKDAGGAREAGIMVPFLGMSNHRYLQRVTWRCAGGRIALVAGDNVVKGAQVYNNYGAKSNEELLCGYGFVLNPNPHDEVAVRLRVPPQLAAAGLVQPLHYLTLGGAAKTIPASLVRALHMLVTGGRADKGALSPSDKIRSSDALEAALRAREQRLLTIGKPAWTARPKTRAPNETADAAVERIRRHENARAYRNGQCIILRAAIVAAEDRTAAAAAALVRTWRRDKSLVIAGGRSDSGPLSADAGGYAVATCSVARRGILLRHPLTSTLSLPQLVSQDVNGFKSKVMPLIGGLGDDHETLFVLYLLYVRGLAQRAKGKGSLQTVTPQWWNPDPESSESPGAAALADNGLDADELKSLHSQLFPALSRAVPNMFPQDVCSWDNFATAAVYVDSNKVPLESGAGALVPVPFRLPKQTRGGGIARVTLEQGFVILRSVCDIEAGVVFDS